MSAELELKKGDKVEVLNRDKFPIWFPAEVLRPCVRKNDGGAGMVYVEYETLCCDDDSNKEYVNFASVRPSPPRELCCYFKVSDTADVFYESRGWRRGRVEEILENSMYMVAFGDEDADVEVESVKVEQWQLRVHRVWKDGSWIPPLEPQLDQQNLAECLKCEQFKCEIWRVRCLKLLMCNISMRPHQEWVNNKWVASTKFDLQRSSSDVKLKSKAVNVKFKCDRKAIGPKFSKGMMVEATSFEEGYHGSWFTAVICDSIGQNKFLLEYQTLRTDDESEPLKEKVDAFNIRPCPPVMQRSDRYKMFEEVDAWFNDGWWEGLISKVLDGSKYVVYFWTTNEELEFEHFSIRPHQEWTVGKWDIAFMNSNQLPNPKLGIMKRPSEGIASETTLCIGVKVEVKDDETWYPALILRALGNGNYFVEFRTIKSDQETELLVEVVDGLLVRPSAPILQRADPFKLFERVDAWFKNGWRVGQVCKVLEGAKYRVCFGTTDEVQEFRHHNLRLHQDWINNAWMGAERVKIL